MALSHLLSRPAFTHDGGIVYSDPALTLAPLAARNVFSLRMESLTELEGRIDEIHPSSA